MAMTCPASLDPIPGINGAARPEPVGGRAPAGGERFALPAARAAAAGMARDVTPASLASLLALQEASEAASESPSRRRGRRMLDLLRRMQLALLDGAPDPAELAELAVLAEGLPHEPDPVLAGLVACIALRARVELARGRARA